MIFELNTVFSVTMKNNKQKGKIKMKKFLALALALICTFSMATVAFASADLGHGFVCDICGGATGSEAALNAHHSANTCGICQYCKQGFNNVAEHEYVCRSNSLSCKYCGDTFASKEQADKHDEAA